MKPWKRRGDGMKEGEGMRGERRGERERQLVRRVGATWKWPATFVIAGATWSGRDTRAARGRRIRDRDRHPRSRLASIAFTPRSRNVYINATRYEFVRPNPGSLWATIRDRRYDRRRRRSSKSMDLIGGRYGVKSVSRMESAIA